MTSPVSDSGSGDGARKPIAVFLLDDHEIVRRGVRDLLEAEPDIEVVGEAGTASSALARIPALKPDVAVLDVRLPDGDGVSVCREIRSRMPEVACLMLTSFGDDEALFDAIMAGAAGYVLKQIRGTDLVGAVRTVASGQSMLDPRAASQLMARLRDQSVKHDPLAGLSAQERRILELIGEGLTNRQIGERMFLAEKTVKNYVSALFAKLGMERRTQAAVYAARVFGDQLDDGDGEPDRGSAGPGDLGPSALGEPVGVPQISEVNGKPCLLGHIVQERTHRLERGQDFAPDLSRGTHRIHGNQDSAVAVPRDNRGGHLVVEGQALSNDVRGVVGAMLQRGSGEQSTHEFRIVGLQVQRDVHGHSEFASHQISRAGLWHVSRDSVQDKPASGRLRRDHRLPQHPQYDLIGHEFAAIEVFLNGLAENGPSRHMIAQQFTRRDVRYAEMRGDQCALGPFARARGRDHQYSHAHLPHLLTSSRAPDRGSHLGHLPQSVTLTAVQSLILASATR